MQKISKNYLLYKIDRCVAVSELYKLVQEYNITVRMQPLTSASGNIGKPNGKANIGSCSDFLERMKRSIMQSVEESYQ